jgi:soluble lytic murein transglycosylase-like protein
MNFNFLYRFFFVLLLLANVVIFAKQHNKNLSNFQKTEQQSLLHSSDCDKIISHFESLYNIPQNLLRSIAMVESEKKPWAVNCAGKSKNFSNKNDAVTYIKKMRAKGFKNINIGCMQINYQSHVKNFKTVEDFLTPYNNIKYAAKYLAYLKNNLGGWESAVKYYHSAIPHHQNIYLKKIAFHAGSSPFVLSSSFQESKKDMDYVQTSRKKPLLRVGFGPFAISKK